MVKEKTGYFCSESQDSDLKNAQFCTFHLDYARYKLEFCNLVFTRERVAVN